MANWLCSREDVLSALSDVKSDQYPLLDSHIAAASTEVTKRLGRRFIPALQTLYFPWPQTPRGSPRGWELDLDADLLSVSSLTSENGTVTIGSTDYFLEPANEPPYRTIEIDLDSAAEFNYDTTSQRAIAVTGMVGYSDTTEAAGIVASGLAADAAATTFVCSDGSLIDVGDTLLIGTEQIFVSERATVTTSTTVNDASVTASAADNAITVADGTKIEAGEVILIEAERMFVQSVTANVIQVLRAYAGTALAAHATGLTIYAFRTLTIQRGINGTTAAVHADSVAISKYVVEDLPKSWARGLAIFKFRADTSGQSGQYGGATSEQSATPTGLAALGRQCERIYREPVFA